MAMTTLRSPMCELGPSKHVCVEGFWHYLNGSVRVTPQRNAMGCLQRQSRVRFRFPVIAERKRALLREANGIYGYREQLLISPSSMANWGQQGGAHASDIMVLD